MTRRGTFGLADFFAPAEAEVVALLDDQRAELAAVLNAMVNRRLPAQPLIATARPGSGCDAVLRRVVRDLPRRGVVTLEIQLGADGRARIDAPEGAKLGALAGVLARAGSVFAAGLTFVPVIGPQLSLLVQAASAVVDLTQDLIVGADSASTAGASIGETVAELSLAATGHGWAGIMLVVRGAHHADPADVARLLDQLALVARDGSMPPVIPVVVVDFYSGALLAEIVREPSLYFAAPEVDATRVRSWWGCTGELAQAAIELTQGRAELIVQLRSIIDGVPQDQRQALPSQMPVWFLALVREQIDQAVRADFPADSRVQLDQARQAQRALEALANVGGTAPLNLVRSYLPPTLLEPGEGWSLVRVHDGFASLHPLILTALHVHPTTVGPLARDLASEAAGLDDAWVKRALEDRRLLTVEAHQRLAAAGRHDVAAVIAVAIEEYQALRWQEATEGLLERLASDDHSDLTFLKVGGLQLLRLHNACRGDLRTRALERAAALLAKVSEHDASVRHEVTAALLGLDREHRDGLLSQATVDHLVATNFPDLRRDAMRAAGASLCGEDPHLAATCHMYAASLALEHGTGFTRWVGDSVGDMTAGPLRAIGGTDSRASRLLDRGHEVFHALACTEEVDSASSSQRLTTWALWQVNGRNPATGESLRALVRGWDHGREAYEAASVFVVSRLLEEYGPGGEDDGHTAHDKESNVVMAIALAERAVPREEPAWWALLSELIDDPERRPQSDLLYGMACAVAHQLGGFDIPTPLLQVLGRKPQVERVTVRFPDGQRRTLTGAHKNWLLAATGHATLQDALEHMRDVLVEPQKAVFGLGVECAVHTPMQAVEDARLWLSDVEDFLEVAHYSPDAVDQLLADLVRP